MQLVVVGYKLKRLSTTCIWSIVENSGFQAYLGYCEWHVEIIITILSTIVLYQCNLITQNMGGGRCQQLNTSSFMQPTLYSVESLHTTASRWAWHVCHVRKANSLGCTVWWIPHVYYHYIFGFGKKGFCNIL